MIYGLLNRIELEIKPAEMISWSWGNIWQRLGKSYGVGIGLLFGLLGVLLFSEPGRLLFKLLGWRISNIGMLPARSIAFGALLFIFGGFLFHILHEIMHTLPGDERGAQSLDPSHLASRGSLHNRVLVGLISGLAIGLLFGVVVGLLMWLMAGLDVPASGDIYWLNNVLLIAFHYGLVSGVLIAVIGGLALASTSQVRIHVGPTRLLAWIWKNIWQRLSKSEALAQGIVLGLIFGIFCGMGLRRLAGLSWGLYMGVVYGLLGGLMFGLFSVLVGGLSSKKMEEQTLVRPNQGIRRSARNSVLSGLLFLLPAWLIFGLTQGLTWNTDKSWMISTGLIGGLSIALLSALLIGLPNGGIACIQYEILQLLLRRAGSIPRQYRCFLDYAVERILLHKVGGGYIFVHRLLLEHFASSLATQPLALTPASIATVCTCGYQDDHVGIHFCPHCRKPKAQNRTAYLQSPSLVSGFLQSARRYRWWDRVFHPSPLVLVCLALLIAIPVVSRNDWDWSHSFYPPPHWHQVLDDSLAKNSNLSWRLGTDQNGNCRFAQGGYRIQSTQSKQSGGEYCTTHNTHPHSAG